MQGDEAIKKLLTAYRFDTVLDVGSGGGAHALAFEHFGKQVTTCDYGRSHHYGRRGSDAARVGDYLAMEFAEPFDCIWCCHVLEHQRNPGLFLEKLFADLREGGVLALTVPPRKPQIVGGHVSLWNAGLLLYHLVLAGFDCSQARVLEYGYNISVLTERGPRVPLETLELCFDKGDIEVLAPYFPFAARQQFDGDIVEVNWHDPGVRVIPRADGRGTPNPTPAPAPTLQR